jgi:hypothetical protein
LPQGAWVVGGEARILARPIHPFVFAPVKPGLSDVRVLCKYPSQGTPLGSS